MKDHLHSDGGCDAGKVILDVDLSDIVTSGCDDGSLQRMRHPLTGSADSDTGE